MLVLITLLLKLADWFLANTYYRAARKILNHDFLKSSLHLKSSHLFPSLSNKYSLSGGLHHPVETFVCDIQGALLRTTSFFPYFMLVAFEGGSIMRAFLLLLSCPFLSVLDHELKLKVMIFITFCGLRVKDMQIAARAVLPKFYLENLNLEVYDVLASSRCKVLFTSVPKVMVEWFLKEYLSVDDVIGTDLKTVGDGKYFSGFVSEPGLVVKHKALKEFFGDIKPDVAIAGSSFPDHLFLSLCKEAYVVNNSKSGGSVVMPRHRYPKPLIFHDGRLAFLPTASATLSMFLWLPIGILLAIFRISVGIFLPYKVAFDLGSLSGVNVITKGMNRQKDTNYNCDEQNKKKSQHVLYVCSHRTLLDPVFLSTSLAKPLTCVTYSVSKVSEILSPIRTVRLTRDRKRDGETMQKLLSEGDLVVCPEGTTCREPYLLRFSALFAEFADEIVPVAVNTHVTMFYGTTASGLKCLDPFFFLMNPRPTYYLHVLGKLPRELTCAGGRSSCEVANYIQRQLGDALGFQCTSLTRRDKYLMLAGNEGIVEENKGSKTSKACNAKHHDGC